MADIGVPELLIILAIAIVLFGPARLAGISKALGDAIREFRHASRAGNEPATAGVQQAPAQGSTAEEQAPTSGPTDLRD